MVRLASPAAPPTKHKRRQIEIRVENDLCEDDITIFLGE